MPQGSTPSGSSSGRAWAVPDSLRPELARRYGPVFTGEEFDRQVRRLERFATCGDVVTLEALRAGRVPFLSIVDHRTRRGTPFDERSWGPLAARERRRVRNPPGLLTEALRTAVQEMARGQGGLLEVEGEEDLAALSLVEELPLGATVIYGIPGEGASFVHVDEEAKRNVRSLIARMEIRTVDLGDQDP